MLTLGLMEGIFSFTAIALVLLGATNANIPLHRILAPPALGLMAIAAYAVYDTGAAHSGWEVLGLLTGLFLGILAPLGVQSFVYNATKNLDAAGSPARVVIAKEEAEDATIHEHPATRRGPFHRRAA